MLDRAARELIIEHEATPYVSHPTWPGGKSGVTIGIGYDLGQHSKEALADEWGAELSDDSILRLSRCCGAKGVQAKAMLPSVRTIAIPFDAACRVFDDVTVPQYERMTQKAFPHCEQAPAGVYGALVSLVYNRGGATEGPGRAEMAAIQLAISSGDYNAVPKLLRTMARVWDGTELETGMRNRRYAEAALAERDVA